MNNSVAQIDTEFWFSVPDIEESHGDTPMYLRISSQLYQSMVKISQPARPSFQPINFIISANSTQTIDLTTFKDSLENFPYDSVLNNGLLIQSDSLITVYYEEASILNPEIFTLKGGNALGYYFIIPSQNEFINNQGNESIDIISTEDYNLITVTPTINIINHTAGTPFSILLMKGQTYSIRPEDLGASVSLSGTIINSDKPIAVTISDDSVEMPGAADLIGDQLIPIEITGKEFVCVRGYLGAAERLYLVSTEDNNQVVIEDPSIISIILNKGEMYAYDFSQNNPTSIYVHGNKKVLAYHLSGIENEAGSAILPAVSCSGSQNLSFVRTSNNSFGLFLITENGYQDDFILNNTTNYIVAQDFDTVPGTNGQWVFLRKSNIPESAIPVSANTISNLSGLFHFGILNKLSSSCEYGFFSSFSGLNLGPDKFFCSGDTVGLKIYNNVNNCIWSNNDSGNIIQLTEAGTYYVDCLSPTGCALSDTIKLINYPTIPSNLIVPTITFNPDTIPTIVSLSLDSINGANAEWIINADTLYGNNTSYIIDSTGNYIIKIILIDTNGCSTITSSEISIFGNVNINIPNIFTPNDDGVNDSFTLQMQGINKFSFSIYNRFGIKIKSLDNENGMWDGKYLNKDCVSGTYFYEAEFITVKNLRITKSGNITLLR